MISTNALPAETDLWVEAAPFRAHLRQLTSVSRMSLSSVALLVGISPRLAFHLLYGRDGRPLRRISPDTARKLLCVTSSDVRAARHRMVPAAATSTHVRRLCAEDRSADELTRLLGISHDELSALVSGRATVCSQQTALGAAAEVSVMLTPLGSVRQRQRAAA